MPYKFEIDKIRLPRKHDRRIKLTDDEREEIKALHKEGLAIREIARRFEGRCSRRLIQFILFPERIEASRVNRDWRNYYDKDKWRETMKEHRAYKYKILTK